MLDGRGAWRERKNGAARAPATCSDRDRQSQRPYETPSRCSPSNWREELWKHLVLHRRYSVLWGFIGDGVSVRGRNPCRFDKASEIGIFIPIILDCDIRIGRDRHSGGRNPPRPVSIAKLLELRPIRILLNRPIPFSVDAWSISHSYGRGPI